MPQPGVGHWIGGKRQFSAGVGREGGTWSFDFFCDVRNTVFAPTGWGQVNG